MLPLSVRVCSCTVHPVGKPVAALTAIRWLDNCDALEDEEEDEKVDGVFLAICFLVTDFGGTYLRPCLSKFFVTFILFRQTFFFKCFTKPPGRAKTCEQWAHVVCSAVKIFSFEEEDDVLEKLTSLSEVLGKVDTESFK